MMTALAAAYPVLRFVGRWILRRLAEHGRIWVLGTLRKGIAKFKRRAAKWEKRGKHLRARFNHGRIHRWQAALRWVLEHWFSLTKKMAEKLEQVIEERIPFHVDDFENFHAWKNSAEGQQVLGWITKQGMKA